MMERCYFNLVTHITIRSFIPVVVTGVVITDFFFVWHYSMTCRQVYWYRFIVIYLNTWNFSSSDSPTTTFSARCPITCFPSTEWHILSIKLLWTEMYCHFHMIVTSLTNKTDSLINTFWIRALFCNRSQFVFWQILAMLTPNSLLGLKVFTINFRLLYTWDKSTNHNTQVASYIVTGSLPVPHVWEHSV